MYELLTNIPITHSTDPDLLAAEAEYVPSPEWLSFEETLARQGSAFASGNPEAINIASQEVAEARKVWLESVRRQ